MERKCYIWIMNADGSNPKQITKHDGVDVHPRWSPDGKKIVFQSNRSGNRDIWIVNTDGSGLRQITNNPGPDMTPYWSPDGKKIVFSSMRNGSEGLDLWSADLNILLREHQRTPEVIKGFIDVDNGKLYYEEAGSGDIIFLIHDGAIHCEIYNHQFLEFAKNYRVIRYDRRGYGKSPEPEKEHSIIEDVNSLFKTLNIEKAAVIGMSMGGGLAIDFALEYPDKVTSLILVGAVVSGFSYSNHMYTRGGHMDPELYQHPDRLREYLFEKDPYEIYPENREAKQYVKKLIDENPHNINFDKHALNKGPWRAALGFLNEIKASTLIIAGEYDIPDVHAHAGAIEAGIPNAKRIIIKNSGHLVPVEQPEEFNKRVLEFLKDIK